MSRDQARENAELRNRLRDCQLRLSLLASCVLNGDPAAQAMARALTGATLGPDAVSQVPVSTITREPAAGTTEPSESP